MSKRQRLLTDVSVNRFKVISLAVSIALEDADDDCLIVGGIKRPRQHAFWMSPFLEPRTDVTQRNTLAKLESDFVRLGCQSVFTKTTRMPPAVYMELLDRVAPLIRRQDTNYRKAITPEERLSLTIRYLTRGDSVTTLHQSYLVGESSVLPIVRDTCKALSAVLHEEFLKSPKTKEEWDRVSQDFHDCWNMPHVLGALDGKHIRIIKPKKTGTLYHNYKKFFSIVLFAMVDANYSFMYVDVGAEGRSSDSTLWKFCSLQQDLKDESNPLGVPEAVPFPGYKGDLPYYFVADDAFEMTEHLMKPYPSSKLTMKQRIFNYRLSRCRRIVENAFGILATRFRILRREIDMTPEHAAEVVMACIVLHNFLRERAGKVYIPKEATDWEDRDYVQHRGIWRGEPALAGGDPTVIRNRSARVKQMRNNLADWCMTKEGELQYQYDVILQHDFFFER